MNYHRTKKYLPKPTPDGSYLVIAKTAQSAVETMNSQPAGHFSVAHDPTFTEAELLGWICGADPDDITFPNCSLLWSVH